MIIFLIVFGSFLMMVIAGVHFYWAMDGRTLSDYVIPTRPDGGKLFNPSRVGTFSVGLVLLAVAVSNVAPIFMQNLEVFWMRFVFGIIFFLRFIGDFRYVGIFKRLRTTAFAKYDTLIYSPLSLLFSAVCLISAFNF